ncbi:MAG: succinylglutamate desuccinylase/aspartoacylase family protein [Nanoarchaeota archaeon]|nr:succinylglutamate desuccinylase/aspartoacylase family protein [Nanoarchaeota archaeon]
MENKIYFDFVKELLRLNKINNYSSKVIGYKKSKILDESFPIYKVDINKKGSKKFCIVAGIHGDEIAGPYSVLKILENPKFFKKEIHYQIFPILNPSGFVLKRRFNDKGRDLNCLNKKTLKSENYKEIQMFHEEVKNKNFEVFLSMHEDLDISKVYSYIFEKDTKKIYRKLFSNERKWKAKRIYGDKSDGKGLIINVHDHSLEDRFFSMGKAKLSVATETPGKLNLERRINMNLKNLEVLNNYLLGSMFSEQ